MDESTPTTAPVTEDTPSPEPSPETSEHPPERSERHRSALNQWLKGTPTAASQTPEKKTSQRDGETPDDEPVTLTKAELARRVQSEADRREARRNRDAAQRQAQQAEADRLRLLDENPIEGAARERERLLAEQAQRQVLGTVEEVVTSYDRAVLDPLFLALPKPVQDTLLKEHGHLSGLESRQVMTKAALKELEKHWRSEGEKEAQAKLRGNPAFRKELLGELRGEREEPEIIPATRPSRSANMNDWLLSSGSSRRTFH